MRHLLVYLGAIFLLLFLFVGYRKTQVPSETRPVVRVYASSSFISQWGPGPWLKAEFEKTCQCRVEYHEAIDSYLLMQKIKSESNRGVDVVLGLDTFDLELARQATGWNALDIDDSGFDPGVRKIGEFAPYNYSQLAFIYRASDISSAPRSLKDLANSEYKNQIALMDPRSSSLGMYFLLWTIQAFGEQEAFTLLQDIHQNVRLYASNWSAAYGLFREKQIKLVLSYVTSPVYHRIEDKNLDIQAAQFIEGHPAYIEYLGVPTICKQCDLAKQYVQLLLSEAGQKLIMEKNYMFPVTQATRAGSLFAEVPPYGEIELPTPRLSERERLVREWNQLRRKN